MANEKVLVTGGSGFIAVYCIIKLLAEGYTVHTTVRSDSKEQLTRDMLKAAGVAPGDRLVFFRADLSNDAGWREAAAGCRFVVHGASPTPNTMEGAEENWIAPARDGMLRILRAAKDTGVSRVVLTSAFGTISYGHKPLGRPFNENDWTDTTKPIPPYQKSKTLAERAAWDYVANEGKGLELSTVHPVAVLGPVLAKDTSHSINIIVGLMNGSMRRAPKVNSGFVDVRDVADLHFLCMTKPEANGQRFLASAGHSLWFIDLARMLKKRLGKRARKVPTRQLPNWIVRLAALRNPQMRMMAAQVGKVMDAPGLKAERLLGWHPRPVEDSLVDTAESLIKFGMVQA